MPSTRPDDAAGRDLPHLATTAHDARLAWTLGGALLIASTLVGAAVGPLLWLLPGAGFAAPALFALALLTFAFGIRGSGSITVRRPLGTAALVLLAVWSLGERVLWSAVPAGAWTVDQQRLVGIALVLAEVALAVVACVQVARAGVVPAPWNLAPCWALIAVVVPPLLQYAMAAAGSTPPDQQVLIALAGLDGLVRSAAAVFLGVMAIVLAGRVARTRTVGIITPTDARG